MWKAGLTPCQKKNNFVMLFPKWKRRFSEKKLTFNFCPYCTNEAFLLRFAEYRKEVQGVE